MKVNRITITGADNSIKPDELNKLSAKYPYVEWAILLSSKQEGSNKFPTLKWMEELKEIQNNLQLSGHLCGKYIRDLLVGYPSFITDRPTIFKMFQRFQLNFHAEDLNYGEVAFMNAVKELSNGREVIFQSDGVNADIIDPFIEEKQNVAIIHDISHGTGILPAYWPNYIDGITNIYAGGLSPKNVAEELEKIAGIVGDKVIGIDVETKVRSNNDMQFDLDLVEQFIINCKNFII